MEQIDQIKAFAELEGVDVEVIRGECCAMNMDGNEYLPYAYYNPITDLALNCAARDKYGVSVKFKYHYIAITMKHGDFGDYILVDISSGDGCELTSYDKAKIPQAIIECILKSEGKWV